MRNTLIIILCAMPLLFGCASNNVPQKLDKFVDDAELKADGYSISDWKKSAQEYQSLVDEYSKDGKEYTDAERKMATRAMGRYHSLMLKKGINACADYLKEYGKLLPEYIEGFTEGLMENITEGSESLLDKLESAIDTVRLEKSLEELEASLEKLFDNR